MHRAESHPESRKNTRDLEKKVTVNVELLRLQLDQATEELEQMYIEGQHVSQKNVILQDRLAYIQRANDVLQERMANLEKLAASRAQDNAAILNSLSWKITAPLRAVLKPFISRK